MPIDFFILKKIILLLNDLHLLADPILCPWNDVNSVIF